jgi:hypothetical protein
MKNGKRVAYRKNLKIMKEVKRIIFVDDINAVDYNNLGVHFTSDLGYSHNGGGSNGLTPDARYKVSIYAKKYEVNESATLISRENHPTESEIVLAFNCKMKAEVGIIDTLTGSGVSFEKRIVNTGTRCDEWVKHP